MLSYGCNLLFVNGESWAVSLWRYAIFVVSSRFKTASRFMAIVPLQLGLPVPGLSKRSKPPLVWLPFIFVLHSL